MSISSIGFHTLSLTLQIKPGDVCPLICDFLEYSHKSKKIIMSHTYTKEGKAMSEPFHVHEDGTFLLPLQTSISYRKDAGIVWEVTCQRHNPTSSSYYVVATINPKLLAGIEDYITASNLDSMDGAIRAFNCEAKRISPVLKEFIHYRITRVDYCINFSLSELAPMCSPQQIMNLIKRSDIPKSHSEWTEYDPVAHRRVSRPSSFYLIGKQANLNCYSKRMQLEDKSKKNLEKGYPPIPQATLDAATDIIRFEVQCKYVKTYALTHRILQSIPPGVEVYQELLSWDTCMDIISDYYDKTIGRRDWYSLQAATKIVKSYCFNKQKENRLLDALILVNQCRSVAKAKVCYNEVNLEKFNQTLNDLSHIGINPVTIPREWNINHIPNLFYSFCDIQQTERRKKENEAFRNELLRLTLKEGSFYL